MPGQSAWSRAQGRLDAARRRLLGPGGLLRLVTAHWWVCGLLSAAAVGVGVGAAHWPRWVPPLSLVLVLVLGGWALRIRSLLVLVAVVAAASVYVDLHLDERPAQPGEWAITAMTAVLMLLMVRHRSSFGVRGVSTGGLLFDLRDRLRAQGEMPRLPAGWHSEVVRRSAYGASFGGDFLVASRSADGRVLETAIVDVSGKGLGAGARALLLSGAFGGLLGALPSADFLSAANSYLLRQQWDEGFATAAHVAVDLASGDYRVANAGHPPPVQFHAGSGRWRLVTGSEGPLLGVIAGAEFPGETGRLERGDALLLYTDGLIETPGRDLSLGIDRLLGEAERLVTGGFRHGARRLVDAVGTGESDDRALLLLWRS
jgi:hypothetical protein